MLRLRPYKNCDAKYIINWIKDERAFRMWSADRYEKYPPSEEDINSHYDAVISDDTFFPFTAFDETGVVGHMTMRFTDTEKLNLRFGFVIVDDTKRGKGYGKEMLKLAINYALNILKVENISLGVFENNLSAYNCYKSVGFTVTELPEKETYHVLNEDWGCIEMEYKP